MESFDAVIVGGGVAGAAMAVALGRFDVDALVLERRAKAGEINRGDALQVAACKALHRMGALDALFQAGAQKVDRFVFSHHRKGRLGSFDVADLFDPPFSFILALAHEKIETALLEEAGRRGVRIRRGETVKEIRREQDRMILSVEGDRGTAEIACGIVIGADGKTSTVRKHFAREPETYWYEQETVVVEAEHPDGVPIEMRMHYHPDGPIVVGPLSPTVVRVYIISGRNEAARIFRQDAEEIGELVVARDLSLRGYRFIKQGGHIFKMGLYHCGRYVAEGCALIGDAAHITSPAGGHGMNLAIHDAEELADAIGPRLAAGTRVTLEDLEAYESRRRQANEEALRFAHDAFMRMTGPQLRHRLLRPLFFWVMANLPAVRRRIARPMLGLGASRPGLL